MDEIGNPYRPFKTYLKQIQRIPCPWCGHARCAGCRPDRFPALADGCCRCGMPAIARRHGLTDPDLARAPP